MASLGEGKVAFILPANTPSAYCLIDLTPASGILSLKRTRPQPKRTSRDVLPPGLPELWPPRRLRISLRRPDRPRPLRWGWSPDHAPALAARQQPARAAARALVSPPRLPPLA